jgi:hypothetical protein
MEWEKRRNALEEGVPLPEDVVLALKDMVEDLGLDPKGIF